MADDEPWTLIYKKMKIVGVPNSKTTLPEYFISTDNEFNLKCLIREGARKGSCSKMCITFQVVLPFSEQNLLIFKSLLLKQNALKRCKYSPKYVAQKFLIISK